MLSRLRPDTLNYCTGWERGNGEGLKSKRRARMWNRRRDRGGGAQHKAHRCRRSLWFRRPCQNATYSPPPPLSLSRLFLCSPIYVCLFLIPSLWLPSICIPILLAISIPHPLPPSLTSLCFPPPSPPTCLIFTECNSSDTMECMGPPLHTHTHALCSCWLIRNISLKTANRAAR